MKTRIARIVGASFLVATALSPGQARASRFYLESTVFPGFSSSNTLSNFGTPTTLGGSFSGTQLNAESGFSYDLRNTAGFTFWDRMLVGFTYNYSRTPKSATAAADNSSLDQVTKKISYGPSIGFFAGNFRLIFSYFLGGSASYVDRSNALDGTPQSDFSLTNHLRNGYQFILGYSFNLTTNLQIGPSLVYRRLSYKSQDASNALDPTNTSVNYSDRAFTTDAIDSSLTPMISVIFQLF